MANNGGKVYGKQEIKAVDEIIMCARPKITQFPSIFPICPSEAGLAFVLRPHRDK